MDELLLRAFAFAHLLSQGFVGPLNVGGARGDGGFEIAGVLIEVPARSGVNVPDEFVGVAGLFNVCERTEVDGILGGGERAERCVDDHTDAAVDVEYLSQELSALEVGQAQVNDGDCESFAHDDLHRLGSARRADDFEPLLFHDADQRSQL